MKMEKSELELDRFNHNPLVREIKVVLNQIEAFKEGAKSFYFKVVLSTVRCPSCGGRLQMTGQSECACSCGKVWDPTVEFQKSICCDAKLVKKTFHYACARCHRSAPSRFIFNERVFDKEYFREMMRKTRDRKKRKREEIRRLLAESRSETLVFMEEPELETIPGLLCDLDDFIQDGNSEFSDIIFKNENIFNIDQYWSHIQSLLGWNPIHFSEIPPLDDDYRRDRAYRFITLVYMQNDRKVDIEQEGNDLFVQRVHHEAHC
ncbi:MAG: hypothetical protein U9R43_11485 [Thermodesulfobacteriota bacterium]|nr:hypothetical protein [Thermodesulfobacteriota bacterium]